ncbi:MAG: IS4 family transposase [Verrucomicrobiota bacterium]
MQAPPTIFSQIISWIHRETFQRIVVRHRADYKIQSFSCWDQFLCMAFAQLTYRESLRAIEVCLRSRQNQLYHLGIRGNVSRSTLAYANETRSWQIYAELAYRLIGRARKLYARDDFGVELKQTAYALDASTIDLCLNLFPWAHFRSTKAGIHLNTLLDLRGSIPSLIHITPADVHEVNWLDELIFELGAFYIMDRGYLDFKRLYLIQLAKAFFVTRAKCNTQLRRLYSRRVDKNTGLRCDHVVRPANFYAAQDYPDALRRIKFYDEKSKRFFIFLTNNFDVSALTICQLYQKRWQVELFFKWIKQNLRIKNFYGTSDNAVRTQIWIAICVYVLVAIIKKELNLPFSLYEILQILSVNAFEQTPLQQLFAKSTSPNPIPHSHNQLLLNF